MFEHHAKRHFQSGLRVLEIGPDQFPSAYEQAMGDLPLEWHTIDVVSDVRLTYSGVPPYAFPIPDCFYDVVLSGQVMEHVPKVWVWIKELARVCRPDGLVITINPVSWPYHEAPVDCWRAYPDGVRALYEEAGLEVLLSTWGSFERPGYRAYLPGMSAEWQIGRWRLVQRLFGLLGLPVERAYDTVTIGRKSGRD